MSILHVKNKLKKNYNKDKDCCPVCEPDKIKILLTSPDKLRLADFAVTVADSVHVVLVELTTACICEVACVVWRPALCHFASVVLSRCHVVEGVVGGLPVEDDHVAGATVNCLRVNWSAGDWWKETENQLPGREWSGVNFVTAACVITADCDLFTFHTDTIGALEITPCFQ